MAVKKRNLRESLFNTSKSPREKRNLNERKFDLGKRHFLRKRKQMLFACLIVHAFVFLYFISLFCIILKIKISRHFRNAQITSNKMLLVF